MQVSTIINKQCTPTGHGINHESICAGIWGGDKWYTGYKLYVVAAVGQIERWEIWGGSGYVGLTRRSLYM
jgi:hypothetical protein